MACKMMPTHARTIANNIVMRGVANELLKIINSVDHFCKKSFMCFVVRDHFALSVFVCESSNHTFCTSQAKQKLFCFHLSSLSPKFSSVLAFTITSTHILI